MPPRHDALTRSVAQTIEAGLEVGAAVARTVAVAAAGNRPVPPPPDARPVAAMVYYALATVREVASLAGRSFNTQDASNAAFAAPARDPTPNAGAAPPRPKHSLPQVRAGTTLRVPLSIENPGERVMAGLSPSTRTIRRDGSDARGDIPDGAITFAPAELRIAPKDFEKLTVFVAVPPGAHPGRYDAVLALGANDIDLPLSFEVTAP